MGYSIEAIVGAIESLPSEVPERDKIHGALIGALEFLFGVEEVPIELIHQAVMTVEIVGGQLDTYFGSVLGICLSLRVLFWCCFEYLL